MEYFLRVNLTDKSISKEQVPEKYRLSGGRLLTSSLVLDEVDPLCDPLGPHNKLILAIGLLGGINIPGSGRLSAGAKSPLTGGIKESNAGGIFGKRMASHGLRAIILEGKSKERNLVLEIRKGEISITGYPALHMKGVNESTQFLHEQYGPDWGVCLIGPAGELGLASACINNTDSDGIASRVNGRGGLGAVMGSKGLKAIVIEPLRVTQNQSRTPNEIKKGMKAFSELVQNHPMTGMFQNYGTLMMANNTLRLGSLPCYNFRQGNMPGAENITPGPFTKIVQERGGEGTTSHRCMPGCIMKCSNIFPDKKGKAVVSPIEYENTVLLGTNLGITDLDQIALLNKIANDLGVDTVEIGAALGVAMDSGYLEFSNFEQAKASLEEIYQGTVFGRLLGNGALLTGKVLGAERIPVVKGQSMAAYDPRTIKGFGVTYATSPMGADHTAGHTLRYHVDHHKPEGQIEASLSAQIEANLYDALGLCWFTFAQTNVKPEVIADLISNYFGGEFTAADLKNIGKEVLKIERTFNRKAGFTEKDDRLPEFMLTEPLPPTNQVFDVDLSGVQDIINKILEE